MTEVLVIFTCKDKADILRGGGTGWWKIKIKRVACLDTVVILHNANDLRKPGQHAMHRRPFLIGKIEEIIRDVDGRVSIQLSRVADASGEEIGRGKRNPVLYFPETVLEGVSVEEWQDIPKVLERDAIFYRKNWDAAHKAV